VIVESPMSIFNYSQENVSVKGSAVVITGGTTGIGRATAILLASEGARLLIFGRGKSELNDTLRDINKVGNAVGLTADASKKEDVIKVFEMADRELGGLDILIDNAALAADTVSEMPIKDQEYIVKTNLLGYMAVVHEAVKRMKPKGKGHIVVVGSMSANLREAGSSVYVATKSGVQGFTEALRKEVNKFGIKVSLIEPGEVGTNMNRLSPAQQRRKQSQLKQLKAEDIADCIFYVLTRPKRVDVVEMRVRPHLQVI
jgi:NADP-dependent 3-hydroxy acid dehydrogenase YdfG